MNYAAALKLVIADQRLGLDETELPDSEVAKHVANIMSLPEEGFTPGGYPLDEDGTETALAYRVVIEFERDSANASRTARLA